MWAWRYAAPISLSVAGARGKHSARAVGSRPRQAPALALWHLPSGEADPLIPPPGNSHDGIGDIERHNGSATHILAPVPPRKR